MPEAGWRPTEGTEPWIASIGHSDHALDRFFALLAGANVGTVVDVRSRPRTYVEHFSREHLAPECARRGVGYHHVPALGGLRDVPYATRMGTDDWRRGYAHLRELAWRALHAGHRAAFLCVERDPAHCHRRFIARRLESDGWRVHHILPDAQQARLF